MALPASAASAHAQSYGSPPQPYPYPQPPSQPYPQSFSHPYQQPTAPPISTYQPQREPSYGGPSPLTPNGGGQNLQELLANLRQTPQNHSQPQTMPAAGAGTPDLGALLSNVARQQNPTHGYPTQQYHQQPSNNQFAQRQPQQPYTHPAGMSSYGGSQQGPVQNVQNIMDQLAKWKQ